MSSGIIKISDFELENVSGGRIEEIIASGITGSLIVESVMSFLEDLNPIEFSSDNPRIAFINEFLTWAFTALGIEMVYQANNLYENMLLRGLLLDEN